MSNLTKLDKNIKDIITDPVKFLLPAYRFTKNSDNSLGSELVALDYDNDNFKGRQQFTKRQDIVEKGKFSPVQKFIEKHQSDNLYFRSTLHNTLTGKTPTNSNFAGLTLFGIDLDFYKAKYPPTNPDNWILDRCDVNQLNKPHFVVHSSELGRQVVWLTYRERSDNVNLSDKEKEKADNSENLKREKLLDRIKLLKKKFQNQLFYPYADRQSNPIQLFRLPGSHNRKPDRNDFKVIAKQYGDLEAPVGFYSDIFDPLYDIEPERETKNTEKKKELGHSSQPEKPEPKKSTITLNTQGDNKAKETPFKTWCREKGPQPRESNDYPVTSGFALRLKGEGLGKQKVKKKIKAWNSNHGGQISNSQINALVRWAYKGSTFDGELDGKGWSAKYATKYCPFSMQTLKKEYRHFENPIVEIEDEEKATNTYTDTPERARALISTLYKLNAHKAPLKASLRTIARLAGISISSLQNDLGKNIVWFTRSAKPGHLSTWKLVRTDTNKRNDKKSLRLSYLDSVSLAFGSSNSKRANKYLPKSVKRERAPP